MAKNSVRELLISTATGLFSRKRYLDSSIREIGEAAQVNPSLFYHYFKNKEEILYIIVERGGLYIFNSLQEIQKKERDPVECLKKMISQCFFMGLKKEVVISLREISLLNRRQMTEITSLGLKTRNLFLDQLKKLKRLNMLKQGNLTVMTFSILGLLTWFYEWYIEATLIDRGEQLKNEEIVNQVIEIIFSGILNSNRTTEGVQV